MFLESNATIKKKLVLSNDASLTLNNLNSSLLLKDDGIQSNQISLTDVSQLITAKGEVVLEPADSPGIINDGGVIMNYGKIKFLETGSIAILNEEDDSFINIGKVIAENVGE